jgi:hypothetical protein
MTRKHTALQLLRLGPLTRAEFIEITGWPAKKAAKVLHWLRDLGEISYQGTTQRGVYAIEPEAA